MTNNGDDDEFPLLPTSADGLPLDEELDVSIGGRVLPLNNEVIDGDPDFSPPQKTGATSTPNEAGRRQRARTVTQNEDETDPEFNWNGLTLQESLIKAAVIAQARSQDPEDEKDGQAVTPQQHQQQQQTEDEQQQTADEEQLAEEDKEEEINSEQQQQPARVMEEEDVIEGSGEEDKEEEEENNSEQQQQQPVRVMDEEDVIEGSGEEENTNAKGTKPKPPRLLVNGEQVGTNTDSEEDEEEEDISLTRPDQPLDIHSFSHQRKKFGYDKSPLPVTPRRMPLPGKNVCSIAFSPFDKCILFFCSRAQAHNQTHCQTNA